MPDAINPRYYAGFGSLETIAALFFFFNPRQLNGFEYAFTGMFRLVIEIVQRQHPVAQIDKIDLQRIDIRIFLVQFDRNVERINPFQTHD